MTTTPNSTERSDSDLKMARLIEVLAKIMPISFEDGPDFMSLYFGDGKTHISQAMTMNPQDWLDIQAAYEAARGSA